MIYLSIFLIYSVVILGCIRVIPISAVHEMGPGCHCFKHLTVFHVVFIFKLTSCIYIYIYVVPPPPPPKPTFGHFLTVFTVFCNLFGTLNFEANFEGGPYIYIYIVISPIFV